MKMHSIPFGITDWTTIPFTEHAGVRGKAFWRTQQFGDIRVRMVEYTPGYFADHWCEKGHFFYVWKVALRQNLRMDANLS